jgi:hypothetical protein
MPIGNRQRKVRHFPHEQTWLRAFVGCHGTDGVTRFPEDDLGGVSLTQIVEALLCGEVVEAEKCNAPGTDCTIEFRTEEENFIRVFVHFVSNEELLTIRRAEIEEQNREPDHAA